MYKFWKYNDLLNFYYTQNIKNYIQYQINNNQIILLIKNIISENNDIIILEMTRKVIDNNDLVIID